MPDLTRFPTLKPIHFLTPLQACSSGAGRLLPARRASHTPVSLKCGVPVIRPCLFIAPCELSSPPATSQALISSQPITTALRSVTLALFVSRCADVLTGCLSYLRFVRSYLQSSLPNSLIPPRLAHCPMVLFPYCTLDIVPLDFLPLPCL